MKRYRYEVTGKGRFPVDMLRYDAAHPGDSAAVQAIQSPANTDIRTVLLVGTHEPTRDRWKSFGWHVREDSVEKETIR